MLTVNPDHLRRLATQAARYHAPTLTGRALTLFDAGLDADTARKVAAGACVFCLEPAHVKACKPLRVRLFAADPPDIVIAIEEAPDEECPEGGPQ